MLAALPPAQPTGQEHTGYAVWGGALIVVLRALTVGSEYGWGTLKTLLASRAGRLPGLGGHMAGPFSLLVQLVLTAFDLGAASSYPIAASEHASLAAPGLSPSCGRRWQPGRSSACGAASRPASPS